MKEKRPARGTGPDAARTREQRPGRAREATTKKPAGARRRPTREAAEAQPRGRKAARESRPQRSAPRSTPTPRPVDKPARPKNATQAKARSKARKAKAPKVVRPPLRQRILVRIAAVDLNPRRLVARVPFVVLVIGSLGLGLGVTLWLSTDAAERSYQLGNARQLNQALLQQKEALERDVLEAQAAPALAEAARNLGMIPSRDTARLVQDPAGNWVVVGTPKPAEGAPPPPLNTPLPEPAPPTPAGRSTPAGGAEPLEVPVRVPSPAGALGSPAPVPPQAGVPAPMPPQAGVPGAEVPHAVTGQLPTPGPVPQLPPETSTRVPAAGAPAVPQGAAQPVPGGAPTVVPGTVPAPPVAGQPAVPVAPVPGAPA